MEDTAGEKRSIVGALLRWACRVPHFLCVTGGQKKRPVLRGGMSPALESKDGETIAPSAWDHWRWWEHALMNVASQLSPWSSCPGLFLPQEDPLPLPSSLTQCLGAA